MAKSGKRASRNPKTQGLAPRFSQIFDEDRTMLVSPKIWKMFGDGRRRQRVLPNHARKDREQLRKICRIAVHEVEGQFASKKTPGDRAIQKRRLKKLESHLMQVLQLLMPERQEMAGPGGHYRDDDPALVEDPVDGLEPGEREKILAKITRETPAYNLGKRCAPDLTSKFRSGWQAGEDERFFARPDLGALVKETELALRGVRYALEPGDDGYWGNTDPATVFFKALCMDPVDLDNIFGKRNRTRYSPNGTSYRGWLPIFLAAAEEWAMKHQVLGLEQKYPDGFVKTVSDGTFRAICQEAGKEITAQKSMQAKFQFKFRR